MRRSAGLISALLCLAVAAPAANAYYSGNPTPGNPLAGHPWFVDVARGSWFVALRDDPMQAAPLRAASYNPMGKTFASFMADPRSNVAGYIQRAESEQPGSIPFLNLARLENQSCPYRFTPAGFSEADIDSWVKAFAEGLGDSRVEIVLETDKLASIGCLPHWAQVRRYRELSYEVHILHQDDPNSIVYVDAGSADWGQSAGTMAARLRRADVAEAQGFVLGASHHDWTSSEVRFGLQISKLLRGKHFVVNTNENGWGPKGHATSWYAGDYHAGCVPPGEGIGIRPTVKTGNPHVDAFLWLGVPGFEGGDCLGYGASAAYTFYLRLAVTLVRNANPPISNGQN